MLPGICPEKNVQCPYFTELCTALNRRSPLVSEVEVVQLVHEVAQENPCSEIRIDDEGPIDPICAAKLASALLVIFP